MGDILENVSDALNDPVNHPSHYEGHTSLECIDAMRLILDPKGMFSFCIGNVIKYLWRHKYKNGEEDLKKADWYLTDARQTMNKHEDCFFTEDYLLYDEMKRLLNKYYIRKAVSNEVETGGYDE